jgi:hypothetical protein
MKPARRIIFMMMVAVGSVALGAEPLSAHAFLEKLCDDFGGRMTGSAANAGAMERLAEELGRAGVRAERMPFAMPGWERTAARIRCCCSGVRARGRPRSERDLGWSAGKPP